MIKYKWSAIRLSLFLTLFSTVTSRAEVKVGDLGALALGIDTSLYSSDNITLDSSSQADTVFSILPTINFRNSGGIMKVDAFIGKEFIFYDKFSQNNSEDLKSNIAIKYPYKSSGENLSIFAEGGINDYNLPISNSLGVGKVVSLTNTDLSIGGKYYLNDKITFDCEVSYMDTDSRTLNYADLNRLTLPFSIKYYYDESISGGLGCRFRTTQIGNEIISPKAESDDLAVYFILENDRSSVWTYEIEIGIQKRDFIDDEAFTDSYGVFASGTVNWFISDRSNLKGEISNEYGTTLANQSTEISGTSLELNHIPTDRLRLLLGLSYDDIKYDQIIGDRVDERTKLYCAADYIMLDGNWILRAVIGHTHNSSSIKVANYDSNYLSFRSIIVF